MPLTNKQRQKKFRTNSKALAELNTLLRKYITFDGHWTAEAIQDWKTLNELMTPEEKDRLFKRWKKEK